MNRQPVILILYANAYYPLRTTLRDHLFFFKKYAKAKCFYFNVDTGEIPNYLKNINFDALIFDTLLLSRRWNGEIFFENNVLKKIKYFADKNILKIALPQDEWIYTDILNKFLNDFKIDIILSVAPQSEWQIIYNKIDRNNVKIEQILTGYIDDRTLKKIQSILKLKKKRTITIGYRASKSPEWLGKHGYLKTKIAEVFTKWCALHKINNNISIRTEDTLFGSKWFEFLCDCEYTIGVEGGSTVHDPKGEIMKAGQLYAKKNPLASYNEFEKNCFKNLDGNLQLIALSPRHLEACATKTCQILIEGNYNGILKPNYHFFPIKKDFSNIDDALKLINNKEKSAAMINNAYKDIVMSGNYSYRNLAKKIVEMILENKKKNNKDDTLKLNYNYLRNKLINFYHIKKTTDRNYILISTLNFLRIFSFRKPTKNIDA